MITLCFFGSVHIIFPQFAFVRNFSLCFHSTSHRSSFPDGPRNKCSKASLYRHSANMRAKIVLYRLRTLSKKFLFTSVTHIILQQSLMGLIQYTVFFYETNLPNLLQLLLRLRASRLKSIRQHHYVLAFLSICRTKQGHILLKVVPKMWSLHANAQKNPF